MNLTTEELAQIIREEVEAVLAERCQKGYKTHPTRKTKKMFGKTYRNCVKAEGHCNEEDEVLEEDEELEEQSKSDTTIFIIVIDTPNEVNITLTTEKGNDSFTPEENNTSFTLNQTMMLCIGCIILAFSLQFLYTKTCERNTPNNNVVAINRETGTAV